MSAKKKSTKRKTTTKRTKSESDQKIERVLVENFVSLQKVMTELSIKFDKFYIFS